jgi:hypothetical protein
MFKTSLRSSDSTWLELAGCRSLIFVFIKSTAVIPGRDLIHAVATTEHPWLKYRGQLTSGRNPVRPLVSICWPTLLSIWVTRVFVAYRAERAGHSLQTCTDALSARGFDLVVNRFSQQIQQLVLLPGLLCKNAGGSGRHLTIQPLFSCPWYTVKPAAATCMLLYRTGLQAGRQARSSFPA